MRYPGPHASRRRSERELAVVVDPRARALQRLVRAVPALDVAASPGAHGTLRDCEARLPLCREMGFDVLYLPPIHPIGRDAAQGPQQRARRRSPTTSAARGRSAPAKAGTRRSIRSSARSRISAPRRRGARARHRGRARHRVPVRARPSVRAASIRSGSAGGPTAPCSTRRTRRRSTRTSIRSTSRPTTGAALWAELNSVVRVLDRRGRAASSASTTRTPSRSRSGSGLIAEVKARASRR